ncbi:MAG: light-harvesting protein [Pseudomonadota bacterium]
MNNAKMWLVVSPSVGVPIFLGAVAVGSFAVHVAVLSNTSWVSDFLSGQELGTGDAQAALQTTPEAKTAKASYVFDKASGEKEITVIFDDGTTAQAVLKSEEVLASAQLPGTTALE